MHVSNWAILVSKDPTFILNFETYKRISVGPEVRGLHVGLKEVERAALDQDLCVQKTFVAQRI